MGFVKLNTDGSCIPSSLSSGVGGLFRDANGKWIMGFAKGCGLCPPLEAELRGILIGLQLAKDRGLKKLVVESDSLMAVEAINGGHKLFGNCKHLIDSISCIIKGNWEVRCNHADRSSNRCADWLAKQSVSSSSNDLTIFYSPPDSLSNLLHIDSLLLAPIVP